MKIEQINYPCVGKYKFYVEYKNKKYTCYICNCSYNFVVTGYATKTSTNNELVTDEKIFCTIIAECLKVLKK